MVAEFFLQSISFAIYQETDGLKLKVMTEKKKKFSLLPSFHVPLLYLFLTSPSQFLN